MTGPSDPLGSQEIQHDDASGGGRDRRPGLPESLRRSLDAYTSEIDRELPGVLTGLYVVGSVALGDYTPKLSDLDVVAVSNDGWTPPMLAVAQRAHHHLSRRKHPVRVAYASFPQLATDPSSGEIACFENESRLPSEELANPFTWHILATDAIALRGPEHPPVAVSKGGLEEWASHQLHDHWRKWLEQARHHHRSLLFKRTLAGKVLEVSRLYEAATTGQVLSKLDAGEALLPQLKGGKARILRDSTGYREGFHTSMYWAPFERKHDALELIDELTSHGESGR
jgi:hypothetical protein